LSEFPSAAPESIDDAAGIASFSLLAHENLSCIQDSINYRGLY